jgi:phosphatidylglycerophosphate synthase
MISSEARSRVQPPLALKAYDTEELADVYFFRPVGAVITRAAHAGRFTPNQVTVLAGVVGTIAGLLLYNEDLGLFAFGLLILHGLFDSADGQLARLTGRTNEGGFFLDGVSDYFTDAAICLGIAAGIVHRGGSSSIIGWALLANVCLGIQAMLYVYHRAAYSLVVGKGVASGDDLPAARAGSLTALRTGYALLRQCIIGGQMEIARLLRSRTGGGQVREDDRLEYARHFYWPKRGWNVLGANTRFYAIGILALLHRLDLFFVFVLIPMNAAAFSLWLWQDWSDRRFRVSLANRVSP